MYQCVVLWIVLQREKNKTLVPFFFLLFPTFSLKKKLPTPFAFLSEPFNNSVFFPSSFDTQASCSVKTKPHAAKKSVSCATAAVVPSLHSVRFVHVPPFSPFLVFFLSQLFAFSEGCPPRDGRHRIVRAEHPEAFSPAIVHTEAGSCSGCTEGLTRTRTFTRTRTCASHHPAAREPC